MSEPATQLITAAEARTLSQKVSEANVRKTVEGSIRRMAMFGLTECTVPVGPEGIPSARLAGLITKLVEQGFNVATHESGESILIQW